MPSSTVTERYEVIAPTPPQHTANKNFMAARFPAGNPEGYTYTVNDSTRTIVLTRVNVTWEPPSP